MKILMSGASGLIGNALARVLGEEGHEIWALVRRDSVGEREIFWDPDRGELESEKLEGFDTVIHLAGQPIDARRWTMKNKAYLFENRRKCAETLAKALANLKAPPGVVMAASGCSYYGFLPETDAFYDESVAKGEGTAAELAADIEQTLEQYLPQEVRRVYLRLGVVVTRDGGAVKKMLLPFQFGLGGPLGHGKQAMSWVALSDTVRAVQFMLKSEQLAGGVNVASPHSVTNAEFAGTLGRSLKRPAFLSMPSLMVRLMFGEMADAFLLVGNRTYPQKLLDAGFEFEKATLADALKS